MTKLRHGYVGWVLDDNERDNLLNMIPPVYDRVVAHHCTLKHGVPETFPLPEETHGFIVGSVDDLMGVQALLLMIGGTTNRPSGGNYHITWSLAEGRKPVESNAVLKGLGFRPFVKSVKIRLRPTFVPV